MKHGKQVTQSPTLGVHIQIQYFKLQKLIDTIKPGTPKLMHNH